jgi:hypothetical protein
MAMTHEFWFKPKTYGYGAVPTTWEGWAVVATYVAILTICVVAATIRAEPLAARISAIAAVIIATVAMTITVVRKTDGAWGWNAGAKQLSGKNR